MMVLLLLLLLQLLLLLHEVLQALLLLHLDGRRRERELLLQMLLLQMLLLLRHRRRDHRRVRRFCRGLHGLHFQHLALMSCHVKPCLVRGPSLPFPILGSIEPPHFIFMVVSSSPFNSSPTPSSDVFYSRMSDDRVAGKEASLGLATLRLWPLSLSHFHSRRRRDTLPLVVILAREEKQRLQRPSFSTQTLTLFSLAFALCSADCSSVSPKLFLPLPESSFPTPSSIARLGKLGCLRQVNIPTRERERERRERRRAGSADAESE